MRTIISQNAEYNFKPILSSSAKYYVVNTELKLSKTYKIIVYLVYSGNNVRYYEHNYYEITVADISQDEKYIIFG